MRLPTLFLSFLTAWAWGFVAPALQADQPGETEWQAVRAIIQERPPSEDAAQHAQRLGRLEAAHAAAVAAGPRHPLRWDTIFFRAMDVLLGPEPPNPAAVETHLTHLRAAAKAPDASPEVRGLSSGLIVLTTAQAVSSLDAARVWLAQAQQHLAAHPTTAGRAAAATFNPQTLPMINELIEGKVIRYAAALKRSEPAAPGQPPAK